MDNYYDSHLERIKKSLDILKPYIKNVKNILNIGYSDFDPFLKEYFKNSNIYYLIPEYENKYIKANNYIKGDICSNNFNLNNKYDLIIFTEVLEHLFCDDNIVLQNIKKIITPKGILLISVPNALTLSHRLNALTGKNIYWDKKDIVNGVYGGYGHIREYTVKEIKGLVSKYFRIRRIAGINGYRKGYKKIFNMLPITYSNTILLVGENDNK